MNNQRILGHTTSWYLQCCLLSLSLLPSLALLPLQGLSSQNQQFANLSGTFWLDLDLNLVVSPYAQESHADQQENITELIRNSQSFVRKDASYVFHGMIYGYQVVYRPPDRFHQQDETFLIVPENPQIISPDDLEIYHTSNIGKRYYYSIRKQLTKFESFNIEAWQRASNKTIQANGTVPFAAARKDTADTANQHLEPELMIQLRKAAIENAIKAAIRSYFRQKLRNKPAQIRVNLALNAIPEIDIDSGMLRAKVRLHIGQYSIDRYETR